MGSLLPFFPSGCAACAASLPYIDSVSTVSGGHSFYTHIYIPAQEVSKALCYVLTSYYINKKLKWCFLCQGWVILSTFLLYQLRLFSHWGHSLSYLLLSFFPTCSLLSAVFVGLPAHLVLYADYSRTLGLRVLKLLERCIFMWNFYASRC